MRAARMTPEEFRRAGHELIDWIADYRERVARGGVSRDGAHRARRAARRAAEVAAAASPKTSPPSAAISMR